MFRSRVVRERAADGRVRVLGTRYVRRRILASLSRRRKRFRENVKRAGRRCHEVGCRVHRARDVRGVEMRDVLERARRPQQRDGFRAEPAREQGFELAGESRGVLRAQQVRARLERARHCAGEDEIVPRRDARRAEHTRRVLPETQHRAGVHGSHGSRPDVLDGAHEII